MDIPVKFPGFLYVYASNENRQNVTAYFDDLSTEHVLSPVSFAVDYYPFGLAQEGRKHERTKYRKGYQGEFAEEDDETGFNHFQLRDYDPVIGRWLTVDPMGQYASPYNGNGNNPIMNVDPTGGENPIYDMDGIFLGTDNLGLQGEAIFMDASLFTLGMAHADALSSGFTFSQLLGMGNADIAFSASSHLATLPSRPDWDGFMTISEGVEWAKAHPGALNNPTPDNSVYLNSALLDFGDVSSSSLPLGQITPINLFSNANTRESLSNSTLRATVYALGRVNVKRVHGKVIEIINDSATDYDWNLGGSAKRAAAIRLERFRTGLDNNHGFRAYYYGLGTLNK